MARLVIKYLDNIQQADTSALQLDNKEGQYTACACKAKFDTRVLVNHSANSMYVLRLSVQIPLKHFAII